MNSLASKFRSSLWEWSRHNIDPRRFIITVVALAMSGSLGCLGADIIWTNAAGGNWGTAANWSPNQVPDSADNVFITNGGTYTVTVSANTSAGQLIVGQGSGSQTLSLDGGTFTNLGICALAEMGKLQINGGTLKGGTVTASGATQISTTSSGGTLDGVTLNGDMSVGPTGQLSIRNGLMLNATLITRDNGVSISKGVEFIGSQTLGGTGVVLFADGGGISGLNSVRASPGNTLTIGPSITVRASGPFLLGYIGDNNSHLINQGTIVSEASTVRVYTSSYSNEGRMEVRNNGTLGLAGIWMNNGELVASNGTLLLDGTWTNTGVISTANATASLGGTWNNSGVFAATNSVLNLGSGNSSWTNAGTINAINSTVNLGGQFITAGLGNFNRAGGTVNLTGTLNNTNSTLNLDSLGAWNLVGGTLRGGTVLSTNGIGLYATSSDGTLDGVNLNAPLQVTGFASGVSVVNGLVLSNVMTIGSGGNFGRVFFSGSQSLIGNGQVLFGQGGFSSGLYLGCCVYSLLPGSGAGATLTIGPGITIRGQGGDLDSNGGTIINQGNIISDFATGRMYINYNAGNFINTGLITVTNGARLTLQEANWVNTGTITAVGGTLDLGVGASRTWTNNGIINLTNAAVNLGGAFRLDALGSFNRAGGTVNLTGTLNNTNSTLNLDSSGDWTLAGGTIRGGTVLSINGVAFYATSSGGTLDGVTFNAPLEVTGFASGLSVVNGMVLNNVMTIGSGANFGRVFFSGSQSLTGNGQVVLNQNFNSGLYLGCCVYSFLPGSGVGATLTIGSGITVRGRGGDLDSNGGTIINQGSIASDVAGGLIYINYNAGNFINAGLITVTNGARLTLQEANWVNAGTVAAVAGTLDLGVGASRTWTNGGVINVTNSSVNLGGTFRLDALGNFNRAGGTVTLTGTINAEDSALTADSANSPWVVSGGTIRNAILPPTDGTKLSFLSGTLDAVTVNTDLSIGVVNAAQVAVTNGLAINGTIRLGNPTNNSTYGVLNFRGTQTVSGSGLVIFGLNTCNGLRLENAATALTVGQNLTIRGRNGQVGYNTCFGGPNSVSVTNKGKIFADVAGGSIFCLGAGGLNLGTIQIVPGATLDANISLDLNGSSQVVSQPGSTLRLGGSILGNSTNKELASFPGTTILNGTGTSLTPQFVEVMSQDLGTAPAGFLRNFAYGTLALANNTYVRLVDQADNAAGVAPEALYANALIVPANCTLDLNGLRLYTRAAQISGTLLGASLFQIPDGGPITQSNPTAGNISVLGQSDEWTFFGRAGQNLTVIVEMSGTNVVAPKLSYAEVSLLDPNGTLLARGTNSSPQQTVVLADIVLSVDGTNTIRVRAPANQPSSTGNYLVTVWEVSPDIEPLLLGQTVHGRIETPYSVDRWTFSAVANQQVRFNLINASASGVAFTLRGPSGWVGFSNLVSDSDLVTLPSSGEYTLSAFGTGGSYDIDYACRLLETIPIDLTIGTNFVGQFVGNGQAQLFRVTLPGNSPFRISLNNGGANNRVELYAGFGTPPTRGIFNFSDSQGQGANRSILADLTYPGTYYILVYGDDIPTPGSYTLSIQSSDIFVTELSPATGGNSGASIVEITGAGFNSTAQVRLEGNGVTLPANPTTWISSQKIVAELDLKFVPTNQYQVVVTQGGTTSSLPFSVTGGVGPQFKADLIMPTTVGLNTVSTYFVDYANTGDLPMVAPLLAVRADPWSWGSSWHGQALFSLEAPTITRDFWSTSNPSVARDVVTFYASGRIPGLLLPGETARVPVYFLGIQPRYDFPGPRPSHDPPPNSRIIGWRVVEVTNCTSCSPLPPSLGGFNVHLQQYLPPSVLNAGSTPTQPDQPLNWQSLRTNVPPTIDPGAWDAIWRNFTNAAGATTYSFFDMQQQNVTYLYRLGVLSTTVNNVDDLLGFELAQADGIHMLRTLATATDGYAPTPGLRLSFDRSFPNTISGRYRMGALGRGWSHNWEERFTTNQYGDVTITGQGGSRRTFKPDVRGGYSSDIGDYGQLVSLPGGFLSLREKGGVTKQFTSDGKLNFVTDPNGNRITCVYVSGRLSSLTHSSGQRLDLTYNVQGLIETITDTIGRTTRFTYHPGGEHLATAEYYDGRILRYEYATGQGVQREHAIRQIEFPDLTHQYFTYDTHGRLETMSRDGGAELVTYGYDNAGTVTATDVFTNTSTFSLDNLGMLVRMANPKGEVVQMRRDGRFNLTSVTDPAGRSFNYAYDRQGNLTEIVNPLGHRTQFAYESQFQRLSQLTDAKANPTRYNYDDRGNLRTITYANGKSENWGYDAIGNPNTWTNRRRNAIEYQFNPTNGFLMAKIYPDGSRADYEYDSRGNLRAASNYTGRISLDYFPTNDRLQRITYPGNRWLEYTYDNAGRRQTMTDHLGYQLLYDYDAVGRLRSITNSDSLRLVNYQYDAAGRMALKTLGNGVYTTYTYDDVGRLEKLTNALPNGSALSFFNYTYDQRGRRTAMVTHYGAWTYGYDDLGQLTNAVLTSIDAQIPNQDLTYLYDAMGNRTRTIENGIAIEYTANNLNEYLQVGGTTYAFDDDGSQTRETSSQGVTTLAYNYENQLIGLRRGPDDWEYAYDGLGNRILSTENGTATHTIFDPIGLGNIVGEFDEFDDLKERQIHGIGLEARIAAESEPVYFAFDGLGSAHEILSGTGVVLNEYAYAPFGGHLKAVVSTANQFEFIGQSGVTAERDGMFHMRNRYYTSATGRFLSRDPLGLLGGDVNLQRYAFNSPTAWIDPTGTAPDKSQFDANDVVGSAFVVSSPFLVPTLGRFIAVETGLAPFISKGLIEQSAVAIRTLAQPTSAKNWIELSVPFVARLTPYLRNPAAGLTLAYIFGYETGAWYRETFNTDEVIFGYLDWITGKTKILVPIFAAGGDPNQKLALTGLGAQGYIQSSALIPYRIDFENETNAAAPAQTVYVTDRLANTLDWQTFELTEIGFGDERIVLPPQTQHFETNLPVTINGASFAVQIQAGMRWDTGQVYCTFRSLDPETELLPPLSTGFLPPEDGTGRGQGFVSFVVRPKAGLATGTEIRNVALIDFDNGEIVATDQVAPHNPELGIDTNKQARVTIDAGPPSSSVTALPAESGRAFIVNWSGQDDAGGSGIASYDVFISTNAGSLTLWQARTTNTSALFIGELSKSYSFYSIARDLVGNEEVAPLVADAQTTVSTNSPILQTVTNQTIVVGLPFNFTNTVLAGVPAGQYRFSLLQRPYGASVNPTNGSFQWTPLCEQGRTTNQVIVWVTDSAQTNLSDAAVFDLVVKECIRPQLGTLVLPVGGTGTLPIYLYSTEVLTNIAMKVELPEGKLTATALESVVPEICTNSLVQLSNALYEITLTACAAPWLQPTQGQLVAWLYLTATSNQPSGFVYLNVGNSIGTQPDGTRVTNYVSQTSRVVIVGEQPLLEAILNTNKQPALVLYALTGTTNTLESATNMAPPIQWQTNQQVIMTNLQRTIEPIDLPAGQKYFRAWRP